MIKYMAQIKRHTGYGSYINYHFEADNDKDAICKVAAHLYIKFNLDAIVKENEERTKKGEKILTLTEITDKWHMDDEDNSPDEILLIVNESNGNVLFMKQEKKEPFNICANW